MHFIPNGIDPAFWDSGSRQLTRAELGLRDDEVLACYVGTIGMAHGLGTVLDAAGRLHEESPKVQILIVGDGAELGNLRSIAASRGLANVRFTGLVPRERVPGILAAADLALVTLKAAPVFKTVLPSKMFEAMAARRTIVLGVDGEARAVLERAGAGVAFPPGDAAALAATIARLAADPAGRRAMGESGRVFVEREFTRSVWARRYIDVLGEIGSVGLQPEVRSPVLESRVP
jgi:glycosyltransferase involved in cell wall biosynthesis